MSAFCLICGDRGTSDAILNVALFLPLGVLLAAGGRTVRHALLAGACLAGAIELAQAALPGRHPTLGDIVWNSLGAAMGVLAYSALRSQVLSRQPRPWPGTVAAMAVVLGTAASGWLLEPAPTREPYWGQWTPDLEYMPQYGGTLLAAELNGRALPKAAFPNGAESYRALTGSWELGVLAIKGPPPEEVSPIASIYDINQQEILLLGAHGEDVVLRERTHAKALRMDHPDLRLPGGTEDVAWGDTMALAARRAGADRCLSVGGTETCGLGFTPGRTWSLLLYLEGPPEQVRRGLDALWMLGLLLPVGFLSSSRRIAAVQGLAAGAGVLAAVGMTRLLLPTWWEALAALAGLVAGWQSARVLRRREPGPETAA